MKTLKYIAAITITCASLGFAPRASAIIDLGQTDSSPANLANEVVRLQGQIDIYNAANDPDLPDAVLAGAVQVSNLTGTSIDVDITGWTYIKLAWDGRDQFYFVGDETGVLTFNSTVFNQNGQPQNLSHYALFNPTGVGVPDGGTTVMLLGAALGALGVVRRYLKS
jgi:VPDSG-CTERM motif